MKNHNKWYAQRTPRLSLPLYIGLQCDIRASPILQIIISSLPTFNPRNHFITIHTINYGAWICLWNINIYDFVFTKQGPSFDLILLLQRKKTFQGVLVVVLSLLMSLMDPQKCLIPRRRTGETKDNHARPRELLFPLAASILARNLMTVKHWPKSRREMFSFNVFTSCGRNMLGKLRHLVENLGLQTDKPVFSSANITYK